MDRALSPHLEMTRRDLGWEKVPVREGTRCGRMTRLGSGPGLGSVQAVRAARSGRALGSVKMKERQNRWSGLP